MGHKRGWVAESSDPQLSVGSRSEGLHPFWNGIRLEKLMVDSSIGVYPERKKEAERTTEAALFLKLEHHMALFRVAEVYMATFNNCGQASNAVSWSVCRGACPTSSRYFKQAAPDFGGCLRWMDSASRGHGVEAVLSIVASGPGSEFPLGIHYPTHSVRFRRKLGLLEEGQPWEDEKRNPRSLAPKRAQSLRIQRHTSLSLPNPSPCVLCCVPCLLLHDIAQSVL